MSDIGIQRIGLFMDDGIAGQSSTMTGTFAGQYVTEGFFGNIFRKEWHRMAITRGISLVPSMLVAVFAVDRFDTMGELLNVLQR